MSQTTQDTMPGLGLVGSLKTRLWGLSLEEWQRRAWTKLGAAGVAADGRMLVGIDWVLSPALARCLLATPGAVLVVRDDASGEERIAAVHVPPGGDRDSARGLVNSLTPDWDGLRASGYRPGHMGDFVGDYDEALRKREAPYALSLLTTAPGAVEARLFKGSYKGVTDIVTKYVWPLPALHVTRLCARLKLTPNMVTTASLALVIAAFYFFWNGNWIAGFVAGWGMTFLDTVDGKLARTTMTYSAWGNVYDHGIDLIHPPFWYWAIFHGLVGQGADQPWLLPALIVILVGYVAGRVIEGIFMRAFGFHIHVWRTVDAFMREITERRNPNLLIFMLATLAGYPAFGLLLVAVWTVVCTVFHLVALIQAYARSGPVVSWMDV